MKYICLNDIKFTVVLNALEIERKSAGMMDLVTKWGNYSQFHFYCQWRVVHLSTNKGKVLKVYFETFQNLIKSDWKEFFVGSSTQLDQIHWFVEHKDLVTHEVNSNSFGVQEACYEPTHSKLIFKSFHGERKLTFWLIIFPAEC